MRKCEGWNPCYDRPSQDSSLVHGCLAHRQRRHECQQNVDSTCTVDQKHQTRRPCLFVIHAEIERRPAPKADNVENPLVVFNSIIFEAHTALRLQVPAFRQAEGSMGTVT